MDPGTLVADLAPERIRPLRRVEYDRLVEIGVFDEDEKVELLHGVLVAMSPQKAAHAEAVRRLTRILVAGIGERASVGMQLPLAVSEDSEPEPDVAVVPLGDYGEAHPTQALLVVEVADTTLRKDRKAKTPLYAAAGVPEYWILNLVDRVIEVHREPRQGRYVTSTVHATGDRLTLVAFPDVAVEVAAVLP